MPMVIWIVLGVVVLLVVHVWAVIRIETATAALISPHLRTPATLRVQELEKQLEKSEADRRHLEIIARELLAATQDQKSRLKAFSHYDF